MSPPIRGILDRLLKRPSDSPATAAADAPATAPPVTPSDPAPPEAAGPEDGAAARRANAFALELWKKLPHGPGNLVISPASIELAFILAYVGARGETAAEMRRVLRLGDDRDATLEEWGAMARTLTRPGQSRKLRFANRLFVDARYALDPAYVERVSRSFAADAAALDFQGAAEHARRRINDWVEEQTENTVKNFLPSPLQPLTRLVLVNAIYFLGDWVDAFDRAFTRPRPFKLAAGGTKDVPMMHRTGRYRFGRAAGVTLLELPYHGNVAMLAVLPDDPGELGRVEASLDGARLDEWARSLQPTEVGVVFPRFTLDARDPLEIKDEMRALGMSRPFDAGRADFRGIADGPTLDDGLYVDRILHKAFVKVDEQGTEAAAATAITMTLGGITAPRPSFVADHPFLFLLIDQATRLILFMGRVVEPA